VKKHNKSRRTLESAIERLRKHENEQRICTCSCGCKRIIEDDSPSSITCCFCFIASGRRFGNLDDPSCEECNSDLQDPAIKRRKWSNGTFDGAVELNIKLNQYLCDWCLLSKNEDENRFIKTRIGDAPDYTGLDLPGDENLKWRSVRLLGHAFGDKWKDYLVQYVGLVRHKFRKPTSPDEAKKKLFGKKLSHLFLSIIHDGVWVIEVRRIRIFYKFTRAYLDIRYTHQHTNPPHVDLINVEYIQTLNAFNTQAKKLWEALALRALVEVHSFDEGEVFKENLDKAIRKVLEGGNDPKQELIAAMLKLGRWGVGDSGKRQLRRRCDSYGINYKERVRYWRSRV